MNLKDAYSILELPNGASETDAKKKFRELGKKLHPDNKATGDEAKFKQINEAYQRIQKGEDDPPRAPNGWPGGAGWNPFANGTKVVQLENVEINLTIDFKESVLGCKKEVKYSRKAKCPTCNGDGETRLSNNCQQCGGKGQTTIRRGGMIFISTCPKCGGKAMTEDCKTCNADGFVRTDVSVHVSVPAGVLNGNVLRLQGMGNFAGIIMGMMDQYTDAFCHITVIPIDGLQIEGKSVVSHLTLSLLDAIRGCKRTVNTIVGDKEIKIPARSRNEEEVIIPHCGVGGTGDQRVILDVQYPQDITKLIDVLMNEVKA